MRVLVACEFSGIVRDAFLARGHDATSCDILPTERPGPHHQGDVLELLRRTEWDLMIAHPPCTYLSRAGARWLYPGGVLDSRRYEEGIKAKEFFMSLLSSSVYKIAIENPLPLNVFELPPPTQNIQPYEYGHQFSKKTLLWLKNLPALQPTDIIKDVKPFLPSNTGGAKRGQKATIAGVLGAKNRSRTFTGIASAMAAQWG